MDRQNNRSNILVVDDNKENLKIIYTILKDGYFNIALATNGKQALKVLEEDHFHLIFLDIMMPEMDGFQVCQAIKASPTLSHIPIIFLTALNNSSDIVKGFELGGVDFITKPFVKAELLARTSTHLDLFHSKQKILEYNRTRDFIYEIIAHDIRKPFNRIAQLINFLDEGCMQPDTDEFAEIISVLVQQNTHALRVINTLTDWTTVLRKQELTVSQNNIVTVVNSALVFFANDLKEKEITIEVNIPSNTQALFEVISMEIVIRNLISNAIKFSWIGGKIRFDIKETPEHLTVSVSDQGCGMTKENLEKAQRGDEFFSTRGTNNEQGSGLGLEIVRDLLKRNGATLDIQSDLDRGSVFAIILKK
jgi:two-component system sensor histidine kinase/response regulator